MLILKLKKLKNFFLIILSFFLIFLFFDQVIFATIKSYQKKPVSQTIVDSIVKFFKPRVKEEQKVGVIEMQPKKESPDFAKGEIIVKLKDNEVRKIASKIFQFWWDRLERLDYKRFLLCAGQWG